MNACAKVLEVLRRFTADPSYAVDVDEVQHLRGLLLSDSDVGTLEQEEGAELASAAVRAHALQALSARTHSAGRVGCRAHPLTGTASAS